MTTIASQARRRWLGGAWASVVAAAATLRPDGVPAANDGTSRPTRSGGPVRRLCTFGDSVLDCRHYNAEDLDPGRLLVHNDDRLFPGFRGLSTDTGPGLRAFEASLDDFLRAMPIRPVVLATVYDPTLGDDARNFLGVDAAIARANQRRVNAVLGELAARHGRLADLHAHFLRGDPSWFTRTIEPSLRGASEIRRVFLEQI